MKKQYQTALYFIIILFSGCGAYFNQPLNKGNARIGENTSNKSILSTIFPVEQTIVGVYKFRDQTGQYKLVENSSTFSTAITQGATSILLKSLEESKWFNPIERENIGNLLNERQIIRSTRQEYSKNSKNQITQLPPLLFAGIILEGGVISYDTNIITGGSGARYFGAGGSVQYREDRITIYLRAVSTSSGRILKNVYASKTILSQGISANLFRYVSLRRILEAETGVTKNEPTQLAIKEAIDKAVETLIIEGIIDGLWMPKGGEEVVQKIKEQFKKEKQEAASTALLDRKVEDRRGGKALSLTLGTATIDGDYSNAKTKLGTSIAYKFYFNKPALNLNVGLGYFQLENEQAFKDEFISLDLNLEYEILPYDKLSPFIYGGVGIISNLDISNLDISNSFLKFQYGLGLEFLPVNNIGFKIFGEQNLLLSDELDELVNGKRDDYFWRIGVGINFYLGKPYKRVKSAIF